MGLLDVWADPVSAATFRSDYLGRRSLHRDAGTAALEHGAQRRSVLAVGPDQEAGLRRLTGADRPMSAAELAGQVPGLDVGRAWELMDLLVRTGFLRAA